MSATTAVVDLDVDRKAFDTLRARLALKGHGLSRSDAADGPRRYWVSRWGWTRELADLEAVEALCKQVGA